MNKKRIALIIANIVFLIGGILFLTPKDITANAEKESYCKITDVIQTNNILEFNLQFENIENLPDKYVPSEIRLYADGTEIPYVDSVLIPKVENNFGFVAGFVLKNANKYHDIQIEIRDLQLIGTKRYSPEMIYGTWNACGTASQNTPQLFCRVSNEKEVEIGEKRIVVESAFCGKNLIVFSAEHVEKIKANPPILITNSILPDAGEKNGIFVTLESEGEVNTCTCHTVDTGDIIAYPLEPLKGNISSLMVGDVKLEAK